MMSILEGFTHKDEWKKRGKDFLIVVSRHDAPQNIYDPDDGPHRWAVYAYIYPSHPHFSRFDGSNMWQDAASMMPLHHGPSFLQWHFDASGIATSVQVGADYHHLYDNYTNCACPDDARQIFHDANELYEWLTITRISNTPS